MRTREHYFCQDRRTSGDRRKSNDPNYKGPERRTGNDRRKSQERRNSDDSEYKGPDRRQK